MDCAVTKHGCTATVKTLSGEPTFMHERRYPRVYQTYTAVNKAYKLLLKLQKCQVEIKIQPDLLIAIRYKPVSGKNCNNTKSYQ